VRILLVSYFFPPYNCIGAVRAGKTAKYLAALGHDVRVLTAADQPLHANLAIEIPAERVVATRWLDVNRAAQAAAGGREQVASRGYVAGGPHRTLVRRAAAAYKTVLHLPDGQVGWLPYAVRAGTRLIEEWRPDVILASAHPITALLVARRLARRAEVPWVAELRDLWTDHPAYTQPALRRRVDRRIERGLFASAAGVVTVSEPLAEVLRTKTRAPVAVVTNGFDAEDYPEASPPPGDVLELAYTGMLYEHRQDARPLFDALRTLQPEGLRVRVRFYGRYLETAERLAREYGVSDLVEVRGAVSHREALRVQREADALLLLLTSDYEDRGTLTGKFFEYVGARRPILAVGPPHALAAQLVERHGLGVAVQDADAIAARLRAWATRKREHGSLPAPEAGPPQEFTREHQTRLLARFLEQVARDAEVRP
jgi:glycosyltransferase involved in cell wall biosynthesis